MNKDVYKKYERLLSYIPDGRENAISQEQLSAILDCKKTYLRALIQNARIDGIPICSVPGDCGYFLSNDPNEVLACYRMFKHRNKSTLRILKTIRKHLRSLGVTKPDKEEGENHV